METSKFDAFLVGVVIGFGVCMGLFVLLGHL